MIKYGKGVCGTAAQTKETQVVRDVHLFPGHIACDSGTNSEIVVPLVGTASYDKVQYTVMRTGKRNESLSAMVETYCFQCTGSTWRFGH